MECILIDGLTSNDMTLFRRFRTTADSNTHELAELSKLRDAAAEGVVQLESRLGDANTRLHEAAAACAQCQSTLAHLARNQDELRPRLMFRSNLPQDVMVSIMGKLSRWRRCAASVCMSWRSTIETASAMGMFNSTVLCVSDAVNFEGNGH